MFELPQSMLLTTPRRALLRRRSSSAAVWTGGRAASASSSLPSVRAASSCRSSASSFGVARASSILPSPSYLVLSCISLDRTVSTNKRDSCTGGPMVRSSHTTAAAHSTERDVAPSVRASVAQMESIIGRDEGDRGMTDLIVPGDLLASSTALARVTNARSPDAVATVVILSGFPWCIDHDPPTETDGPPGALAIARAAVGLGHRAILVTDNCNAAVFRAAMDGLGSWAESSLALLTFPPEKEMTRSDHDRMTDLVRHQCDLIVACERAGPASDGNCYTMRAIDVTSMVAPLHLIVDLGRERDVLFVAIGDGGNELGMGKVYDVTVSSTKIKNGSKIGAVTKADHLIAAGVSNRGGYALATGAALVRSSDDAAIAKDWVDRCVPTEAEEVALLNRCVRAGCRDGVSGKMEATVDGLPLDASMDCLRRIREAALM